MPQPIDINTEIARSTTAQRVQEIADRASLAAQQRTAQHVQKARLEAETVVQETPESEHDTAVDDQREDREQQRRQKAENGAADDDQSQHAHRGAGDIEVIPDQERHRLDVNA